MSSKKLPAVAKNRVKRQKPSAFISAPFTVNTSYLVHAVEKRGLEAIRLNELSPGSSISDLLRQSMDRASYVIAVVGEAPNADVWYELGIASAMGKPVLLLASHQGVIPIAASGLTYLKADPDNEMAIEFGLDQLLATPKKRTAPHPYGDRETHPIGASADRLLEMLERSREDGAVREAEIIDIIYLAIKESGVSSLAKESRGEGRGILDIAVWSSDFEPLIGNPLVIEVKKDVAGRKYLEGAIQQISAYLDENRSRYGLLLYLAAKPVVLYGASYDSRVVVMSVEEFISGLRDAGLADLLLRVRNDIAHVRG